MQIKVNIIELLPIQSGTNKAGKTWQKLNFIGITSDEYPKKICFTAWSDEVINNIMLECDYFIDFDVESREYNGKYYTDVKAYKVVLIQAKEPEPIEPIIDIVIEPVPESNSELPF